MSVKKRSEKLLEQLIIAFYSGYVTQILRQDEYSISDLQLQWAFCTKCLLTNTDSFVLKRKGAAMLKNTSKDMRMDPLFMRNTYVGQGKWGIPVVKKQSLELDDIALIACSDTRSNDNESNTECGVHFFVDDYRFNNVYFNPKRSLGKLSQYKFLLTPDFSMYAEMQPWRQLESLAHSRWCGAYWQDNGKTVIPTISWSTPSSYEYCFDGVEKNSIVAIGMIGCKSNKAGFLRGYNAMLDKLSPELVICFGTPFSEMQGNILPIDYCASGKVVR